MHRTANRWKTEQKSGNPGIVEAMAGRVEDGEMKLELMPDQDGKGIFLAIPEDENDDEEDIFFCVLGVEVGGMVWIASREHDSLFLCARSTASHKAGGSVQ